MVMDSYLGAPCPSRTQSESGGREGMAHKQFKAKKQNKTKKKHKNPHIKIQARQVPQLFILSNFSVPTTSPYQLALSAFTAFPLAISSWELHSKLNTPKVKSTPFTYKQFLLPSSLLSSIAAFPSHLDRFSFLPHPWPHFINSQGLCRRWPSSPCPVSIRAAAASARKSISPVEDAHGLWLAPLLPVTPIQIILHSAATTIFLKQISPIFYFWLHHLACEILVPQARIKPVPTALEVCSLNHWTAKRSPKISPILKLSLLPRSYRLSLSFTIWPQWYIGYFTSPNPLPHLWTAHQVSRQRHKLPHSHVFVWVWRVPAPTPLSIWQNSIHPLRLNSNVTSAV